MLRQDIKFAIRSLIRRPALSGVIVVTLAVAIGANATIYSLVSSLFFGSIQVDRPQELIEVYGASDRDSNVGGFQGFLPVSYPNFEDLREGAATLEGMYAYSMWPVSLELGAEPERSQAMFVSSEYFDVLGVPPALGRAFEPTEDDVGGVGAVAVISHAFWQERFGGSPEALGSTFRINTRSYTVVGVAPQGFRGTSTTVNTDIWVPISMIVDVPTWGDFWQNRGARFFFVGARLAGGRNLAEADGELRSIWAGLQETYPTMNRSRGVQLIPLLEARVNPNFRSVLAGATAVLAAVVGVLLLIACMNVANLLLARSLGRGQEMAVRTSIGAGRRRLVAQLLTESTVLFGVGGLAGLGVALLTQSALSGVQPPGLFGATLDVQMDIRVVGLTAAVTFVCGMIFGLIPAWRATRSDIASQLRDGRRDAGAAGGARIRGAMVAGQVALSLVALVGAGLFLRALGQAGQVPLGFVPEDLEVFSVDLGAQGYSEEEGRLFYREALDRLAAVPGVRTAAVSSLRPLNFGPLRAIFREGEDPSDSDAGTMIREELVSAGFVATVGASLLRGRDLEPSDVQDAVPVALVNQEMADRLWPNQDPLGQRFHIALPPADVTVVGVIETGKYVNVGEDPAPAYFRPVEQAYSPTATFFLRTPPGSSALLAASRELQAIDPSLPVFDAMPAGNLVAQATWNTRAITFLLGVFGLVGLVLAAVGVYGVVATSVRQRTREIGLRMALGAQAPQMVLTVVRGSLAVTGFGIAVGLGLAALLARPLTPQLFGVSTTDLPTYAGTASILGIVAVLAAYLPARRAARVEPTEALRAE